MARLSASFAIISIQNAIDLESSLFRIYWNRLFQLRPVMLRYSLRNKSDSLYVSFYKEIIIGDDKVDYVTMNSSLLEQIY